MTKNKILKPKICLIALNSYPLLSGYGAKNIIGPDIHIVLLAKAFSERGLNINIITFNDGGPKNEIINGIKIIKIKRDEYNICQINTILRILRVWAALLSANCQIYFHAGNSPGYVSLFCRLFRKRFVYEIASDALVENKLIIHKIDEFSPSKLNLANIGNVIDIKLAHLIIVQNEYQQLKLKKNFSRYSQKIKMSIPINNGIDPMKASSNIVLWVGSISGVKQPELFIKLARSMPKAKFRMIGGYNGNKCLYDQVRDASTKLSNFEYLDVVPFDEIGQYFDEASILVNTSMFEGFPNAFLQAWMYFMPVISLNANPDNLLDHKGLGFHSKTFCQLIKDVTLVLENERLRKKIGERARAYVRCEHDIEYVICDYIKIFEVVLPD